MSEIADHVTVALARDMARAASEGMRVLAVTSTSSLVAGLLARELQAADLALAVGFGVLDARPEPALTRGEFALGSGSAVHGPTVETFMALGRGRAGVVVTPAQLDARCATNLSRISGDDTHPGVALPGSRGLPENNHSRSRVWYLLPEHSRRTLVDQVDFVSGGTPPGGRRRLLVTRLGVLDYSTGPGWTILAVMPGVTVDEVRDNTGFEVRVPAAGVPVCAATTREADLLADVDPHGLRRLEVADADTARRLTAEQAAREAGGEA